MSLTHTFRRFWAWGDRTQQRWATAAFLFKILVVGSALVLGLVAFFLDTFGARLVLLVIAGTALLIGLWGMFVGHGARQQVDISATPTPPLAPPDPPLSPVKRGQDPAQRDRRRRIIGELRALYQREYIATRGDGIPHDVMMGTMYVPPSWLNAKLAMMGEDWRVSDADSEWLLHENHARIRLARRSSEEQQFRVCVTEPSGREPRCSELTSKDNPLVLFYPEQFGMLGVPLLSGIYHVDWFIMMRDGQRRLHWEPVGQSQFARP